MTDADPSKQRIISVELDEGSIVWRNPDVEQERRVAIFDLIEDNKFVPQRGHPDGYAGPYRLMLRVEDGRLIFEISREDGSPLEAVIRRADGNSFGCEFVYPLHPSVAAHMQSKLR
jgi:uncharacterized protein (UPF0262 family)